jgi:hypothetical protein
MSLTEFSVPLLPKPHFDVLLPVQAALTWGRKGQPENFPGIGRARLRFAERRFRLLAGASGLDSMATEMCYKSALPNIDSDFPVGQK